MLEYLRSIVVWCLGSSSDALGLTPADALSIAMLTFSFASGVLFMLTMNTKSKHNARERRHEKDERLHSRIRRV